MFNLIIIYLSPYTLNLGRVATNFIACSGYISLRFKTVSYVKHLIFSCPRAS